MREEAGAGEQEVGEDGRGRRPRGPPLPSELSARTRSVQAEDSDSDTEATLGEYMFGRCVCARGMGRGQGAQLQRKIGLREEDRTRGKIDGEPGTSLHLLARAEGNGGACSCGSETTAPPFPTPSARSEDADIKIKLNTVSRQHAILSKDRLNQARLLPLA